MNLVNRLALSLALAASSVGVSSLALADVGPPAACTANDVICTTNADCGGNSCGPLKCLDPNGNILIVCEGGVAGAGGSGGSSSGGSGGSATAGGGGSTSGGSGGSGATSSGGSGGSGATSNGGSGGQNAVGSGATGGSGGGTSTPAASDDSGCTVSHTGARGAIAGAMVFMGALSMLLSRRRK